MTKFLLTPALLILLNTVSSAQLISKFTWETSDPKQAAYGPNATSISSYAVVSTGGSTGNGLNPGAGQHDIDMILPGSSYKISSLDISVDFKRKESVASFFILGGFDFGVNNGALYVKYLLKVNNADVTINAQNLYNVPSDNAFHTYRFIYNASTGAASVTVDGGNQVYSYQATAGTALSWTGAGDATIGNLMDGTGSNVAILDNLVIQNPLGSSTLPLHLVSFGAAADGSVNTLAWTTTQEDAVRGFEIQRSTDGSDYETIGSVGAQTAGDAVNNYSFTDNAPAAINFYRLKMVDIDGNFTYSPVKKVSGVADVSITCYPNPVVDRVNFRFGHVSAAQYSYSAYTVDGRLLQTGAFTIDQDGQQVSIDLTRAPKGIVFIRLQSTTGDSQNFEILKK